MTSPRNSARITALLAIILALAILSIPACTNATTPEPTPTPAISREQAIEAAIAQCQMPHFALIDTPQNIRATLLTLQEADRLTRQPGETINYDLPMDTPVWMVQMDGHFQLIGGPAPASEITPTPRPPAWRTCTAVLDANSGKLIFKQA